MLGYLPDNSSADSLRLFALAGELASGCPIHLGTEIVVIGSVGLGVADRYSDIDLEFWVESLPEIGECLDWLLAVGVESANLSEQSEAGMHFIGAYRGTWVEFGWCDIQHLEAILQEICSCETTARSKLVFGWNISHAVTLRSAGYLEKWQALLSVYPERLQADIITNTTAFWRFPHHLDMLWTLAARQEMMGLDE